MTPPPRERQLPATDLRHRIGSRRDESARAEESSEGGQRKQGSREPGEEARGVQGET